MRYYDVSRDDKMVVDKDGSVWVFNFDYWQYINDEGELAYWDARADLPEEHEPYAKVDKAAQKIIWKGLAA